MLAISCLQILRINHGNFCYPLDDSFIHMTIARNFALNGTWGINTQEFSSASSSPLYTIILATCYLVGFDSIWMPFYVNAFFAILLLITSNKLLLHFGLNAVMRCITLSLLVLCMPLAVMVVSGMEHTLHTWLSILLVLYAMRFLSSPRPAIKTIIITGMIAALAILSRFEALFLLAAIIALGIYRKKWLTSFSLLIMALLPMVIFGIISVKQGGYFLPNSVLLKGSHLGGGWQQIKNTVQEILVYKLTFGNNTMMNIFTNRYFPEGASSLSGTSLIRLLIIIPFLLLTLKEGVKGSFPATAAKQGACLFIITCFLHLALAGIGWLFRYEAYLVAWGILAGSVLLYPQLKGIKERLQTSWIEKGVFLFLLIFSLSPLPMRAARAYTMLPQACNNIYEQQVQMGKFLAQYYPHSAVAVNDIGAVSYLSNSRIIDMWGLGNNTVATAKLHGKYSSGFLLDFSRQQDIKIAVIYDSWFDNELLKNWKKIATWQIPNNVICGAPDVSFYAVNPAAADSLAEQLKAFKPLLPADVQVTYSY
jgi:hypothetical protein